jgi:hypothetical protein
VGGVDLESDEGQREACRRYRAARAAHQAALQAEREEEAWQAAERRILHCSFCYKPKPEVRILWGCEPHPLICDECLTLAVGDVEQ